MKTRLILILAFMMTLAACSSSSDGGCSNCATGPGTPSPQASNQGPKPSPSPSPSTQEDRGSSQPAPAETPRNSPQPEAPPQHSEGHLLSPLEHDEEIHIDENTVAYAYIQSPGTLYVVPSELSLLLKVLYVSDKTQASMERIMDSACQDARNILIDAKISEADRTKELTQYNNSALEYYVDVDTKKLNLEKIRSKASEYLNHNFQEVRLKPFTLQVDRIAEDSILNKLLLRTNGNATSAVSQISQFLKTIETKPAKLGTLAYCDLKNPQTVIEVLFRQPMNGGVILGSGTFESILEN